MSKSFGDHTLHTYFPFSDIFLFLISVLLVTFFVIYTEGSFEVVLVRLEDEWLL